MYKSFFLFFNILFSFEAAYQMENYVVIQCTYKTYKNSS